MRIGLVLVMACSPAPPIETLHSSWTAASPEAVAVEPRRAEPARPRLPPPIWFELEALTYTCTKPGVRTSPATLPVSVSTPSTFLASVARCELRDLGTVTIVPAPTGLDVAVELASAVREPSGDLTCKVTLTFSSAGQLQGKLSSGAIVSNTTHPDATLMLADCVEAVMGDAIAKKLAPWFVQQTSGWVAWPSPSVP